MKKLLLLFFVLIFTTGCGTSDSGNTGRIILDGVSAQAVAAEILEAVEIPSAVQKTKDELGNFIQDLNISDIEDVSYYICGSGAYPDELLIIRFNQPASASLAISAVQNRLDKRKIDFTDYRPDEMYKFDDAVVQVNSNWLFFFITEDNAKVAGIINSLVKA